MNSQDTGVSGSSNVIITYRNDGGTLTQQAGTTNIQGGSLFHCAVTKRGTALKTWVNGVNDGSATFGSTSDAFTDSSIECGIGYDTFTGDSNAFIGQIGYVFLFSRELSKAELQQITQNPWLFLSSASPAHLYALVPFTKSLPASMGSFSGTISKKTSHNIPASMG